MITMNTSHYLSPYTPFLQTTRFTIYHLADNDSKLDDIKAWTKTMFGCSSSDLLLPWLPTSASSKLHSELEHRDAVPVVGRSRMLWTFLMLPGGVNCPIIQKLLAVCLFFWSLYDWQFCLLPVLPRSSLGSGTNLLRQKSPLKKSPQQSPLKKSPKKSPLKERCMPDHWLSRKSATFPALELWPILQTAPENPHILYISRDRGKVRKNCQEEVVKNITVFCTPQTESWDDNVEDKVAKQCLRPPNPKRSRGSKAWIEQLHKGKDSLVDEQDHEEESQDDAVLLQGDQGLAITRDFVGLGHSVRREVEVQDAEQDKKEEGQTDQFGLQWEGLEVFKVGDFLLAAKLPCEKSCLMMDITYTCTVL